MTSRFSKLRFWSDKSCQACKGQPTPPPCYNCVQGLETPPPAFTSLHEHFYSDGQSSLYPHTEEYTYPEDAGIETYYQDNEASCQGRTVPFGFDPYSESSLAETPPFEVHDLSRAVGNIALAFLPEDQRQQHHGLLLGVDTNTRTRHMSSPVFTNHQSLIELPRRSSIPQFDIQDNDDLEDDRETITGSNRSLMEALALPTMQLNDQLFYQEPLSPRGVSPLPCQLLIPE